VEGAITVPAVPRAARALPADVKEKDLSATPSPGRERSRVSQMVTVMDTISWKIG
jgi:hypothetical protein